MTRTKNTIRNIFSGTINKLVVLFFPFLIRTVLIKQLGSEYLGLNSLFTSIIQVLNLTELGFSSAIVFSMYKPIAENDTETICTLLNLYKKIYRIIGSIILLVGILILPFLPNLINGSYPSDINIYVLYLIYLFNTVITYFLFAYKTALLTAHQRDDILSNIQTITSIFQYSIQILVLCFWKNYYAYIVINTITTVYNNIITAIIVSKKYPQYICVGNIDKERAHDIKKRVLGLMIQKICATTRNSLDSIFLSAFLGLNIVAMYSNYYSILVAIIGMLTIITSSMIGGIGNSIATESIDKNYNDMNKFNFLYMWIAGWCTICLICLYQPFMEIWMGKEYLFPFGVVILFSVYFYALKMGDIRSAYVQGSGIWWEGKLRAVLETITNVILNWILGKMYGVYGIILATIISILLINFGYGSTIIFKYYFKGKKVTEYFKSHAIYASVTIIIALVTYMVCSLLPNNGIGYLIIKGIICLIIPNILYVLLYRKTKYYLEAKEFFKNILKKIPKVDKMIKV